MKKAKLLKYNLLVERMSQEDRKEYLEKRLRQIVRYAYDNAPASKQRFDRAGIKPENIRTVKDLEKIPVLRKDELVYLQKAALPFGGLVAVPIHAVDRIYISPGPIFEPHKRGRGPLVFADFFEKGDIVVNTWAYHLVPGGCAMDELLRSTGATVIPWGTGNTELLVQVMHELEVAGFCGTASFLMTVIQKAEEIGYDFRRDFKMRKAFAGGEMGGGPLRRLFREKYGIETMDLYGIADAPTIAFECRDNAGLHLSMGMVTEIVDPETGKQLGPGEVGEIVVTVFDEVYPLIRFGTGDLSSYTDEPCACGRTTPRLPKIMGRVGDAVRTRGMFIHPRQLEPALAKFSELARYQAVITRPTHRDELTLKVELEDDKGTDKEKLTAQLIKAVSEAVRIKVDRIEFVPKGTIPEGSKIIVDERVY